MRHTNKLLFAVLLICVSAVGNSTNAQSGAFATSTASFQFTRNLSLEMSGDDVSTLQKFLIDTAFLKISAPTGYFGSLTKTAVSGWQTLAGINPPAGYFGSLSRERFNSGVAIVPVDSTLAQPPIPAITSNGSPVRLKIPSLSVDAGFQFDGLNADGTMAIPTNITDVGWYTDSPRPGEIGNSIITGHIAQIRRSVMTKQGVFFNLNQLRPGDSLSVLNDRGETVTFVVRESKLYEPTANATDIFTSKDGRAHLVLITCEGTWNQAQLEFTQRRVVFADAVQ